MKEELQIALTELLKKTNNGLDSVGDLLATELPEVIQQLLLWHGVKSFIFFISALFFAVFSYRVIKAKIKEMELQDEELIDRPDLVASGAFTGIGSIVLIARCVNLEWLQIMIAPKIFIIEYIAKISG